MKYLKVFEKKWNQSDLRNLLNDYDEVKNLIKDFIVYNFDEYGYTDDKDAEDNGIRKIQEFYYILTPDEVLRVHFRTKYLGKIVDIKDDYLIKLFKFLKNPNMYKNIKKYNL
ncbi:hypothetical protein M0Q97_04445 [Candidatus Dojkabacteria bacterium]|jgi:hypothetical protein|nr:hypothetical protein [Candidatus Dojkabacteria bacterium]